MNVRSQMAREGVGNARREEAGGRKPLPAESGLRSSIAGMEEPLFVEDIILPEQYFAPLRRKTQTGGEERLLLAVLDDAIHCFQSNIAARTPRRQRLFREAEQWLLEDDADASVTLDYVCTVFGMDINYLRARLLRWRDQGCETARPAEVVAAVEPAEQAMCTPELQEAVGA